MTSHVLTVTDEKRESCIFGPIQKDIYILRNHTILGRNFGFRGN